MSRSVLTALVLLLCAGAARAQDAPEALLPATTQVYLRWDGVEAHRAAYEKTALGKMMQGDTGAFFAGNFGQLQTTLGALLTAQALLTGTPPDQLQKLQTDAAEAGKALALFGKHGVLIGFELRSAEPPEMQLTLVVPDAGAAPGPIFGALRLVTTLARGDVKTKKIDGRSVQSVSADPVHVAWWVEGKHAVVTAGTDPPEAAVKRVTDRGSARLTEHALFKKVRDFKEFETGTRGFLDVAGLFKVARGRGKDVEKLLTDLGLDGLRGVTFCSGFDGPAARSVVEIDMPGPRKGLLRLAAGKPFTLADVPPVPDDAASWSMTNFDAGAFYDLAVPALEQVVRLVSPDDAKEVAAALKAIDDALGIDLRKDLLAALGDRFATYSSPAEGPLTLGQTYLFQVKDEKKLREALESAVKGLAKTTGAEIAVKKKTYRGVELSEVHVNVPGFIFIPTYAVHKGWLVVSYYPQAVQGYVLRAAGELPAWKPDAQTAATLAKLPKEYTSISVSDPRPALRLLLSFAPLIARSVQQGLEQSGIKTFPLDIGSLPNANEATRHLFPNVSVTTDDGKRLRLDSRTSLQLPFDLVGLDSYTLLVLGGFFVFNLL
jgi:hypothetical protein